MTIISCQYCYRKMKDNPRLEISFKVASYLFIKPGFYIPIPRAMAQWLISTPLTHKMIYVISRGGKEDVDLEYRAPSCFSVTHINIIVPFGLMFIIHLSMNIFINWIQIMWVVLQNKWFGTPYVFHFWFNTSSCVSSDELVLKSNATF